MEVILNKDVDGAGASGDVVTVSDGYARNYLFPKNLAVKATKGSLEDLNRRIDRIKAKAEKKYQADLEKAEKINVLESITLEANAGETGKLFGTITTKELANVLQEKTGLEIERKSLNLNSPINKVGEYQLNVKISSQVDAQLVINVKAIKSKEEEFILAEAFADDEPEAEAPQEEVAEEASSEEE